MSKTRHKQSTLAGGVPLISVVVFISVELGNSQKAAPFTGSPKKYLVQFSGVFRWGRGGAGHTLAPKKKGGGEKDVDLRPHTYIRTRGAKYRCRLMIQKSARLLAWCQPVGKVFHPRTTSKEMQCTLSRKE